MSSEWSWSGSRAWSEDIMKRCSKGWPDAVLGANELFEIFARLLGFSERRSEYFVSI